MIVITEGQGHDQSDNPARRYKAHFRQLSRIDRNKNPP